MRGVPRRDMLRRVGKLTARAFAAVVTVALLVASAAAQQSDGDAGTSFSADERRRLDAGQLVTRAVSRRRGQLHLIGGSSWQVVDQPVDVAWRALQDHRAYTHMLPATQEARLVSQHDHERVMRIRHAVGFVTAQYHLRLTYDDDRHDVAFRLDRQRPSDLRAAWGFIQVQPYEDTTDRTLVSYGVMADPGGGMLGGVLRGQIHDWLLRVPSTIRGYLHGAGAHRY